MRSDLLAGKSIVISLSLSRSNSSLICMWYKEVHDSVVHYVHTPHNVLDAPSAAAAAAAHRCMLVFTSASSNGC